MKEKKGIALISLIVIMLAIITAILVTIDIVVIINGMNKDDEKVKLSQTNNNNNIGAPEENDNISEEGINKWVGRYQNRNTTIDIWRENINQLAVNVMRINYGENITFSNSSFYITLEENTNEITHEGEMLDEKYNAVITYMDDGIRVEATSSEAESILNNINGDYVRKEFERSGWDGLYVNGETSIILSEIYENKLSLTIIQGYSINTINLSEYTSQNITYNDINFEEEENLVIEKTESGIKVQASTTEEDGLLNKINGEYVKEE